MHYFYLLRFLIMFFPIALYTIRANSKESAPSSTQEVVVYQGKAIKAVVPEQPLAAGSLRIIPYNGIENFSEWKDVIAKKRMILFNTLYAFGKREGCYQLSHVW